jgi:hypothetical protein
VLTLGQNYALVYMLLPTNQDYWLRPALDRLPTEENETAQKNLILLLWYAQTEASDKAITSSPATEASPQRRGTRPADPKGENPNR